MSKTSGWNRKWIMDFPNCGIPPQGCVGVRVFNPMLSAVSLTPWPQTTDSFNASVTLFTRATEGWQNNTHSAAQIHSCTQPHATKSTWKDNLCFPPFPHTPPVSLLSKGKLGMSGTSSWQIIHQRQSRATIRRFPWHTAWPTCLCLLNHNTCFHVCVHVSGFV